MDGKKEVLYEGKCGRKHVTVRETECVGDICWCCQLERYTSAGTITMSNLEYLHRCSVSKVSKEPTMSRDALRVAIMTILADFSQVALENAYGDCGSYARWRKRR